MDILALYAGNKAKTAEPEPEPAAGRDSNVLVDNEHGDMENSSGIHIIELHASTVGFFAVLGALFLLGLGIVYFGRRHFRRCLGWPRSASKHPHHGDLSNAELRGLREIWRASDPAAILSYANVDDYWRWREARANRTSRLAPNPCSRARRQEVGEAERGFVRPADVQQQQQQQRQKGQKDLDSESDWYPSA